MLCDNLKLLTILVAAHVLLLLGCADASPSTSKPTSKVATFTSTEMDNLQSSWSPPELDTPRLTPAIHNLGVEFHTRESDIIARAQVVKVETQIHALDRKASEKIRQSFTHIPGEKIYFPAIAFELKVLEWLKGGSGSNKIWALATMDEDDTVSSTTQEALNKAAYYWERRDKRWDSREAIVFLLDVTEAEAEIAQFPDRHYFFLGTFMSHPPVEAYSVSGYGGWYPASSNTSGASGASGSSAQQFLLTDPVHSGGLSGASDIDSTMDLSEFRRLAALSETELDNRHLDRAKSNMTEWITVQNLTAIATDDSVTLNWDQPGQAIEFVSGYRILRKSQRESTFVQLGDVDAVGVNRDCYMCPSSYEDRKDIATGVQYTYIVRALTEDPNNGTDARVNVTISSEILATATQTATVTPTTTLTPEPLADGVIHEAFFDPAPLGVGVGANSASDGVGALKPAEFKHSGATVAIEQIEWSPNTNKVALKLSNQSAKLAGHHIDFIELDASVSLRLDIDDAETTSTGYGQTLSWEVCRQPWHPGDQLMLRIAKSASTDSVTIKPVCVDDGKPAATATPTPKTTPTHTPTVTADTTATPTYTPTASPTPPQPTATVVPTATPTNTPATAPTATSTHTPTIAPTATETSDGSGDVVSGQ